MAESEEELKNLLMRVKEESETAGLMLCFHDCSHEIRRHTFASWKESYDRPREHFKKQRKVHIVKAMVFPVVMYGRESWIIKKAEH